MKRKKLTLNRETVRTLASYRLALIAAGATQGAACDNSVAKTQCDLQGCALVCTDSCGACDSLALTCQGGSCTTP